MSEQNVHVVRRIYEAIAKGDVPAFLGALDPNVEWRSPESLPYGGTYRGPQDVGERYFGGFMTHVEDFRLEADEMIDAGDRVAVVGRLTGRARETGASFETPSLQLWTVDGGRVTSLVYMIDTAKVLGALRGEPVT